MTKLYVGNLPNDVTEADLRHVFRENSLPCGTVLIKRGGYAFVDCADQSIADRAIDKLNGCKVFGPPLLVEPSVAGVPAQKKSSQLKTPSADQEAKGWKIST